MPILRVRIQLSGWGVSSRHTSFWSAGLCDIEGTRGEVCGGEVAQGHLHGAAGIPEYGGCEKSRAWRSLGVWIWEGTRQLSWKAHMVLSTISTVSLAS